MELKGKITQVFPLREGDSARGHWMSQSYLLEMKVSDSFQRHMVFDMFGEDRIKRVNVEQFCGKDEEVVVYFDIDARSGEGGRWYNTIRAYDVRSVVDDAPKTAEEANAAGQQNTETPEAQKKDDLPY